MSRVTHQFAIALGLCVCALTAGCGTTKWSDSARTATEQMLISDAADRAISEIDFAVLADRNVYLDTRYIATTVDQNYVVSTLRQHMLANGCIIKDKPEDAQYVVEVRTGSLGTNRQDLLFGIPATNLPTPGLLPSGGAAIPEVALMKRTNQQAVCKIAVFAYDRMTGRPVWQSGNRKIASRAKDTWVMGAGPFQRGTIYEGTAFAGEKFDVPLTSKKSKNQTVESEVGKQMVFVPGHLNNGPALASGEVSPATFQQMLPPGAMPPGFAPPGSVPPGFAPPAMAAPAPVFVAEAPGKPSYTPPTPPPAATPPFAPPPAPAPPPTGPQGPLSHQSVLPPAANPAASTAGALQTLNWAKDMVGKK